VVHAGGNFDGDFFLRHDGTGPAAPGAGVRNGLPLSTARGACGANREKALASGNLSHTATLTAGFGLGARFTPASLALRAGFLLSDIDLGFGAKGGIHEVQLQIEAQVRSALDAGTPAATAAETKKIFEDTAEAGKDVFESSESGESGSLESFVAKLVVDLPLVGIPQNFVGLRGFLEFLFGFLVSRVLVRMISEGQFPVGGLELVGTDFAANAEYFVVIPFVSHEGTESRVDQRVDDCEKRIVASDTLN
jgi:hypothetical protein